MTNFYENQSRQNENNEKQEEEIACNEWNNMFYDSSNCERKRHEKRIKAIEQGRQRWWNYLITRK